MTAEYDTTNHQYNYDHPDWHPYLKGTDLHSLQSVTKSFTSALVGIAIQQSVFQGIDERVLDFFPDLDGIRNLDGRKRAITIEDLLTMRSGTAGDAMRVTRPIRNIGAAVLTASNWASGPGSVCSRPLLWPDRAALLTSATRVQLLSASTGSSSSRATVWSAGRSDRSMAM